ncbi:MAG TPA: hypothetical protein ENG62_03075 [Thermoplasmatales archaeon]|nr:hypothetical protein [Thermoplasmatales archaeon]
MGWWWRIKFLTENHSGVAGVIEALLLVALVAVIISTIQLVYIPEIMEQREADHMDEVEKQFSDLKSTIDLQTVLQRDVPISSPITLGSRELPYFVTARALGELEIIDNTTSRVETDFVSSIPLTSIRYQAINAYYLDQTYILEGGGVIIKQYDGEVMDVDPAISFENRTNEVRIHWILPQFNTIPGKSATSGFKTCFIRTNYSRETTYEGQTSYIKIYSEYLDAWNTSLNRILEEPVRNGYIKIYKNPPSLPQYVYITPGSKNLYVIFTVANIVAQIGPGAVVS